ncbi:putative neutral sphingomyelinase isoform X2 [Gigantopelta aegis]|nr:putative neutral sphingomyelinase isoform X2 [Gigantopelta aegis]
MLGTGCCVFSKFPIGETMYFHFSLNGFAHKVWHADWYAGKGVGLCKMVIDGLHINLYSSHIHAEYNRANDEYLSHRIAQCFEMSQFIKQTSGTCDLVILAGDLNMLPSDLGYRVILTNGNLQDCWTDKEKTTSDEAGNTCELPDNSYTSAEDTKVNPLGKRIDYILYRANQGVKVFIKEASVTMGCIPGKHFHYSDHEALEAVLRIEKSSDVVSPLEDDDHLESERNQHLLEAIEFIDIGMEQSKFNGMFFQFGFLLLFILLFLLSQTEAGGDPMIFYILLFVKLGLTLVLAFCFWTGVMVTRTDANNFLGIKLNIANVLKNSKVKIQ